MHSADFLQNESFWVSYNLNSYWILVFPWENLSINFINIINELHLIVFPIEFQREIVHRYSIVLSCSFECCELRSAFLWSRGTKWNFEASCSAWVRVALPACLTSWRSCRWLARIWSPGLADRCLVGLYSNWWGEFMADTLSFVEYFPTEAFDFAANTDNSALNSIILIYPALSSFAYSPSPCAPWTCSDLCHFRNVPYHHAIAFSSASLFDRAE